VSYMRGNITENVCLLENVTIMFFFSNIKLKYLASYPQ